MMKKLILSLILTLGIISAHAQFIYPIYNPTWYDKLKVNQLYFSTEKDTSDITNPVLGLMIFQSSDSSLYLYKDYWSSIGGSITGYMKSADFADSISAYIDTSKVLYLSDSTVKYVTPRQLRDSLIDTTSIDNRLEAKLDIKLTPDKTLFYSGPVDLDTVKSTCMFYTPSASLNTPPGSGGGSVISTFTDNNYGTQQYIRQTSDDQSWYRVWNLDHWDPWHRIASIDATDANYVSKSSVPNSAQLIGTNENGNFISSSGIIDTLNNIEALMNYTGNSVVVFVFDSLRGGEFYKSEKNLIADSGIVFNASDGNYWVRQYNQSDGINIQWFGAKPSDGYDDFYSIEKAINKSDSSGLFLYFPPGTFLTSRTLYISGRWIGAGMNSTIIRAASNAIFDTIETLSYPGIIDRYKYRPMICTPLSQDQGLDTIIYTVGISISNMTIDYNNTPMNGGYSPVAVLMGHTDGAQLENLLILNCENSDINEWPVNYGSNLYFSFSKDANCTNVNLTGAGYESLMIRDKSENIKFHNGTIAGTMDTTRSFTQYHLFQTAVGLAATDEMKSRFENYKPYGIYVYDCHLYQTDMTGNVGTSHDSRGFYIFDNYISYVPLQYRTNSGSLGIKPFSGTTDAIISGNIFDYSNYNSIKLPQVLSLNDNKNYPTSYVNINNNIIKIKLYDGFYNTKPGRAIIGTGYDKVSHAYVVNNLIEITNCPNDSFAIISLKGEDITVQGNKAIVRSNVTITSDGPIGIYADSLKNSTINGNSIRGVGEGLFIDSGSSKLVIIGNNIISKGDNYNIDLADSIIFQGNIGSQTKGSVVFTGDGTSTSFVVNISSGFTPSNIIITPTTEDAAKAQLWVDKSTITNTQFTVKAAGTVPPSGTDNVKFNYQLIK